MKIEELEEIELVIYGETNKGKKFRPSDWAERLAGLSSIFEENKRLCYSLYIQPGFNEEASYLIVKKGISICDKNLLPFLITFAKDNDLKLITKNFEEYGIIEHIQ